MKLESCRMYFKKEIQRVVQINDLIQTVSQSGSTLSNFWLRLNDDDEVFLKDVQDSEWCDPFGTASGKCKIYVVEIPAEIVNRIREQYPRRKRSRRFAI